ncbi:bifunctional hydroxymethylpyrimidine kinase/phosphomethylpyrimidine kinase [Halorubrum sp. 48-1-W]|uniref:bifunctional hydroxymethylpyrimidine kinase/phosphomethylpyrimidine kinase n=1 Tax=Halorubrum sp. 48-1-W TaxID=2249761 RepID=UPI000DCDD57B|nr:bifunctional hydroxymethylpyrimidine kinase/phosphomethylpyrimidine kinase [Halorubrum sp. 48-1-W]RAW45342.1 bifunctional hydroxymethylpyrimidine kinase/phosphomethylpyrimidine kinase [Halorubrum sp. 48-1-W]
MSEPYDPVSPPVALTIAGSDSGSGAGIQADLKAMTTHGVFGTTVVTATTAQNTRGVHDVTPLSADHVAAQYDAVVDDFAPRAVKTGMLATREVVEAVTGRLGGFPGPVVVDPVMVAATGDRLLSAAAEAAYDDLVAAATLVTPNADEAAVLVDDAVETPADAAAAGRTLVDRGADAALVKGGHLDDADGRGASGEGTVVDTLVIGGGGGDDPRVRRIENPRVDTDATHGSGCVLSSSIVARLARGEPLEAAVVAAVDGMGEAIRRGYDVGTGPGAVNPTVMDVIDGRAGDDP